MRQFAAVRLTGSRAGITLATAAALALGQGAAHAQAPASISVSSPDSVVRFPDAPATSLRVDAASGPAGARFGVSWLRSSSLWPVANNVLNGNLIGQPLAFSEPFLEGPGTIRPIFTPTAVPVAAASTTTGTTSCLRGSQSSPSPGYWIEMPADSNTTIVVPVALSDALLPGTQLIALFETLTRDDINSTKTPLGSVVLSGSGLAGVRITLRNRGKFTFEGKPGTFPGVVGTTEPAIPGAKILLRAVPIRPGTGAIRLADWTRTGSRSLGAATTNANGVFRTKKRRFAGRALYRVVARLARPPAGFVADWACGQLLDFSPKRKGPKGG